MQLHESMDVALCLIENGEWAKAGSTPDTYIIRTVLQERGQAEETGLVLVS